MTEAERHNTIVFDFMNGPIRAGIKNGLTDADLVIIAESIVLGVIFICERHYGLTRRQGVEWVEMLTQNVLDRLAKVPAP